ncbi:MAG: peptidase S8 [Alphaproteobacteria bacterium]|nr:MAG: peptidase S8 [Alphaproteobacteria bacterium]
MSRINDRSSLQRFARAAIVFLAAGAMIFSSVADGVARSLGGGRGMGGDGMRTPGNGGRFPGNDGPRYPGGGGPRFPGGGGGVIVPGGYGPGNTVVIVDDGDQGPVRRKKKAVKKQKRQQQQQIARRGGFDVPPPGERRFVTNEVLLNISAATSIPALDAIARRNRLTRLETQDFTLTRRRLARLRINDGRPVATVIRSLQADARILGAQPNYLHALQQAGTPPAAADPLQYALTKLRLPEAHALAKGASVLVAVVDTPIDTSHPDLADVVVSSFDATGAADKPHAHGTGIASVIAAHGRLTGAAPGVKLLAVHAFGSARSDGTSLNILKGLDWAGKSQARIINMSFAGPADEELHRMLAALRGKGAVLIAAVGNAGPNSRPLYPAADPEVIAVTATDNNDRLFAQANRGTHIAVAAPGVDILLAAPNGSYQMQSGTSFAAAQVSGIAALLIERNPTLDAASIRRLLMSTARDLGAPGHDEQYGSGLADALAAVTAAGATSSDVSSAAPAPAN